MISEKSQVRYKSHGSTTNLWYNDNKTKHNKTMTHNDAIKWKKFPRYWSFVRGINRSPVNSPHKGHWRGALMFSLICALNKRFTKQSWGRWFEMPSHSLWRHCNAYFTGDTAQALGRSACCQFSMLWECRLSDIRKPIKKPFYSPVVGFHLKYLNLHFNGQNNMKTGLLDLIIYHETKSYFERIQTLWNFAIALVICFDFVTFKCVGYRSKLWFV